MRLDGHLRTDIPTTGRRRSGCCPSRDAFTLVDTLVSILVIAVLIGLLLPSLRGAQETARRVACSSNVRQIGIGLAMYADQERGVLPGSVYLRPGAFGPRTAPVNEMMTLRVAPGSQGLFGQAWDGLGFLYSKEFLPAPRLYYCPSHRGENPYSKYASLWPGEDRLVGNYHYRGRGKNGTPVLAAIDPQTTALVADGLRSRTDLNHTFGLNAVLADLSVRWVADPGAELTRIVPNPHMGVSEVEGGGEAVQQAWDWIDRMIGVGPPMR